ncbi:NUDIX hydrolase [Streptacidiphilus pinicola]|uniref:NUDIX hydrolase n=1 Tax=Streptacidiphilus pinicola TaxID=2219663 RepID=A0A2X0I7F0_9ACTN|nr:NUDIX hydrolase [Streptacidiphilus pinicola]RAG80517.1 NUDIX hydrolase [Streptacidiphilus pinicola]
MSEQSVQQPGIAVAVVVDNGRVLMVRRRVAEGELDWQFPAGGIEAGEDPLAASARETFEETGLDVDGTLLLGERVHPVTGRHISYVVCRLIGGEARVGDEEELAEVAWVTLAELPAHVPTGLFQPVQDYLDQHLDVAGTD